jgi:putative ABC transport system substrate-binding protein
MNPSSRQLFPSAKTAAEALGVETLPIVVHAPEDIDGAFATAASNHVNGVLDLNTALTFQHRPQVVGLSLKNGLPAIHLAREYVVDGALMAYGWSVSARWRRCAACVDKILKGARPADLPVEQATVFELVVNLKTAQALGLTIPPDVAAQVTEWIQ